MSERQQSGPQRLQWRSLADAAGQISDETVYDEFPAGSRELELDGMSRRRFLGIVGSSMAFAGLSATACRKPVEHILPYAIRPEDLVPGRPLYFRTAYYDGEGVLGLHVESTEGRPTKVEGNPDHPMSNPSGVLTFAGQKSGATNGWAQASVLDLYDPDRSRTPVLNGVDVDWQRFWDFALGPVATEDGARRGGHFQQLRGARGRGLAVLVDSTPSPTLHRLLQTVANHLPQARIYRHEALSAEQAERGAEMAGARGFRLVHRPDRAAAILALDSDFLGFEGDAVRNAALFAHGRAQAAEAGRFSQLFAVEPTFTITGLNADNRLRLEAGRVGHFLRAVATALFARDPDLAGYGIQNAIRVSGSGPNFGEWPDAVAEALLSHRGRSLVVVGKRQPGWVHALAHLLNDRLDNIGETIEYIPHDVPDAGSLAELARAIDGGGVSTLLILGGNPAYTAPAELGLGELLERVDHSIHLGLYRDETAGQCRWHLPASHYLEAWGDLVATDGTIAVQQPLIAPIMPGGTRSPVDLLGRLLLATGADLGPEAAETGLVRDLGYPLVRATHRGRTNTDDFERTWREWIHDGVVGIAPPRPAQPRFNYRELVAAVTELGSGSPPAASETNLEIDFATDPCLHDGRHANNGWLQELPDPITKLTWDNAALISPKTARDRGLDNGDMVALSLGGRRIEVPVWKAPGTADNVVVLPLGYGRRWGNVAEGAGFDAYPLRTSDALYFKSGARLEKTGEHYTLATTQEHAYMRPRLTRPPRPLVREATVEVYRDRENPERFEEVMHEEGAEHATPATQLFQESNVRTGQQWGMSIDLTRCTGCSACVVACQAENNISIVGKERVLQGREMHWIRIDRYYTADIPPGTSADQAVLAMDDPQAVVQPVPCMQCEMAPCETVCPVGATAHSPSGLNDMAYNRCIGTRYCSNNCPYKVRRFNYFNFTKENDKRFPLHRMQKNPDVTLRFRGVMEKCTYCVQRINRATIDAHVRGSDVVLDGVIVPACAQACPTRAIVFGDVADPASEVSQLKASDRDYTLLASLNNRPRTSYAAKLRNPNPRLV